MTNVRNVQRDYQEKRDFIRMEMNSPATITINGKELNCVCLNLSGVGLLIEIDNPLPINEDCEVYLPSFQQSFPPLKAKVNIAREETKVGNKYRYGLAIQEIIS